jgi:hypothetical protein
VFFCGVGCVSSPFGVLHAYLVWLGCLVPGLYEVVQFTLSLSAVICLFRPSARASSPPRPEHTPVLVLITACVERGAGPLLRRGVPEGALEGARGDVQAGAAPSRRGARRVCRGELVGHPSRLSDLQ